nr:hypothetical protein GCM10020241_13740 [Streptoalloteichus tenebrarius]
MRAVVDWKLSVVTRATHGALGGNKKDTSRGSDDAALSSFPRKTQSGFPRAGDLYGPPRGGEKGTAARDLSRTLIAR